MAIKVAKKKVAKKKVGNHKIYTVQEVLTKYNLTPDKFQSLAQEVLKPSHITDTGITSVGLMIIGKAVKKIVRDDVNAKVEAEANAPIIRDLQICGMKPPNQSRLWCIDWITVNGKREGKKVVVNVTNRVHEGAKPGVMIKCEKIDDGLFTHPPLERP